MLATDVSYELVGTEPDGCNPVVMVRHIASGICATDSSTHSIMLNRQIATYEIEEALKKLSGEAAQLGKPIRPGKRTGGELKPSRKKRGK